MQGSDPPTSVLEALPDVGDCRYEEVYCENERCWFVGCVEVQAAFNWFSVFCHCNMCRWVYRGAALQPHSGDDRILYTELYLAMIFLPPTHRRMRHIRSSTSLRRGSFLAETWIEAPGPGDCTDQAISTQRLMKLKQTTFQCCWAALCTIMWLRMSSLTRG